MKTKKKGFIRVCPKCKSAKVIMPRGDGLWWRCVKCGFEANNFPEMAKQRRKR
jgi:Zn ribbon nucleic-acid-binding protein